MLPLLYWYPLTSLLRFLPLLTWPPVLQHHHASSVACYGCWSFLVTRKIQKSGKSRFWKSHALAIPWDLTADWTLYVTVKSTRGQIFTLTKCKKFLYLFSKAMDQILIVLTKPFSIIPFPQLIEIYIRAGRQNFVKRKRGKISLYRCCINYGHLDWVPF